MFGNRRKGPGLRRMTLAAALVLLPLTPDAMDIEPSVMTQNYQAIERFGGVLATGDFDGDGQDELIVGERQGRRSVYLYRATNARDDIWSKEPVDDGGMAGAGCAVADLNADKRPDVVCIGTATANLKWYENRPAVPGAVSRLQARVSPVPRAPE